MTSAWTGHGSRWYEVTSYMIGPLFSFPFSSNVINSEKWSGIPDDLRRILIEEAAKSELEALRLASIQNEMGVTGSQLGGVRLIPFSEAIQRRGFETAMKHVIPAWLDRLRNPGHPIITDTFNNKLGPIVGLRIDDDGSVAEVPITEGPEAGEIVEARPTIQGGKLPGRNENLGHLLGDRAPLDWAAPVNGTRCFRRSASPNRGATQRS